MLIATKSMGGESTEAWRAVLDDLIQRDLRRPEFLIIDGASGLRTRLAPSGKACRCSAVTVHKQRNLLVHAPERLHDEITANYNDIIYAISLDQHEPPITAPPSIRTNHSLEPA
jgi:putative transposase